MLQEKSLYILKFWISAQEPFSIEAIEEVFNLRVFIFRRKVFQRDLNIQADSKLLSGFLWPVIFKPKK
jgi:hypothetical protein